MECTKPLKKIERRNGTKINSWREKERREGKKSCETCHEVILLRQNGDNESYNVRFTCCEGLSSVGCIAVFADWADKKAKKKKKKKKRYFLSKWYVVDGKEEWLPGQQKLSSLVTVYYKVLLPAWNFEAGRDSLLLHQPGWWRIIRLRSVLFSSARSRARSRPWLALKMK